MSQRWIAVVFLAHLFCVPLSGRALPQASPANTGDPLTTVNFSQSAPEVGTYDYVEVTLAVTGAEVRNPFTEATVNGDFGKAGETRKISVVGFCDSTDGHIYRIRFMPSAPGEYTYSVTYRQGSFQKSHQGTFRAAGKSRRGPIRVDEKYPWHFLWEGTGEHYFFNGTTAYWLMGWREERIIKFCLERLHQLKVNRLRVLLSGDANMFWGEPVMIGENFTMMLRPWPAQSPGSYERPGIDYTRFDPSYWQRFERMLLTARDRDMIISVVMEISVSGANPVAGSEDELRFFRYALARLSAFSNITWDLGDDLDSFRDEKWTRQMGSLLHQEDPYRHLATSHPIHPEHQDRAADWFGFTSIQDWSRRQHQLMLEQRQIQLKTGRIIPQSNEEYGYEDHYPRWAPEPPGDSAETLRRVAWDIAMAGAYGTGAESCRRGVNIWPDTGGGWINGRGDDTMVMFRGYGHMVDFFTSFDWWKTEPHDELVNNGAYCLAQPGQIYAVYLPKGGNATIKLESGRYAADWFDPQTGDRFSAGTATAPEWKCPDAPGLNDWALLLKRAE
jgi:hypothetical protein